MFQALKDYLVSYWFYESLCLLNVILQIFFLDKFLSPSNGSGFFINYPSHYAQGHIFPLKASCKLEMSSPSDDVPEIVGGVCYLTLNLFNRYIFLTMWHWLRGLVVILSLLLLYRVLLLLLPRLRYMLLRVESKNSFKDERNFLVHRLSCSDWWVLYSLKSNIDPLLYRDVILELSSKLNYRRKNSTEFETLMKIHSSRI